MTRVILRAAARVAVVVLSVVALAPAQAATHLPLAFETNQGQYDSRILFSARARDRQVWLTREQVLFSTSQSRGFRLQFLGASPDARVRGAAGLPAKVNHLIGTDRASWRTGIPTFARVRYEAIYPGIDLEFYGNESGRLEYDFIVSANADPSRIRLRLVSPDGVRLGSDGTLRSGLPASGLVQRAPVIYQTVGGTRRLIAGSYQLTGDVVTFRLGDYDRARALVIDPVVEFASYLGGAAAEESRAIAVDKDGNIYLAGDTLSPNFPTANPLKGSRTDAQSDAFVSKISSDGRTLIWSTYLGGTSGDSANAIAVDGSGAVYVGGLAGSSFPVTDGGQPGLQGDSFLAKLAPNGQSLVYATYVAGARLDAVTAIAIDSTGALYATGRTTSNDFPTTAGVVQPMRPTTAATTDAFVIKLNPQGARVYSTIVGGNDDDAANAIAVRNGSAYIAGSTQSPDLPVTAGAVDRTYDGPGEIFVARLNPAGSAYELMTYFGGTNNIDEAFGIALDVFGNIYLTGTTNSNNFPVTDGAFQPTRGSAVDGFAAKLNAAGTQVMYSTHLGGGSVDHLNSIAVDVHGAAYIVGQSQGTYPVTSGALQPAAAGSSDLVLTKVGFDGRRLLYSSFLGGSGAERSDDPGNTIAERNCVAYITGRSLSMNFPTANPLQASSGGGDDGVFAKIDPSGNLNEPQIGCNAGVLANLIPTVRKWVPGAIATIFGSNFGDVTNVQPTLDSAGLVSTVASGFCIEVNGRRSPMYHVIGSAGQLSFQVPVETEPGWATARVVGGCGTSRPAGPSGSFQTNEVRSEPLFVEVVANAPVFFIFTNLGTNPLHIAAVNETQTRAAGNVVFVGPASAGGSWKPAKAGDLISLYFTGGGATQTGLGTGQIPQGLNPLAAQVSLTIGEMPATITYAGEAPGVPGQGQLIATVPALPAGNHAVVFTANGVPTPGGVIAVE
ncbi:MAG: SBBP repeat-containing protein [Bryobacteraceae bacterium]